MTKTRGALHQHARKRADKRYQVEVSREDMQLLIKQIQENKGEFLARHSNRVKEWRLHVNNKPVRVLYDSVRKAIITFLPPETKS